MSGYLWFGVYLLIGYLTVIRSVTRKEIDRDLGYLGIPVADWAVITGAALAVLFWPIPISCAVYDALRGGNNED